MKTNRRSFIAWLGLTFLTAKSIGNENVEKTMKYGLIGKIIATSGKRDELAEILLKGISRMPGCLSYIISLDTTDENALWVTEVWENKSKHEESLQLESVQNAISKGRPLIAGFGERHETVPLGGTGI